MDTTMYEIVGNRSKEVLKRMQKAVLSGTLNITRTFKVVTWETFDFIIQWIFGLGFFFKCFIASSLTFVGIGNQLRTFFLFFKFIFYCWYVDK